MMGSPEDEYGRSENETQHPVILTEGFYMGKYEVTQAQYKQVMGDNPSFRQGDERRPVERVYWFHAIDFCNRLSDQEGLPLYYDLKGEEVTVLGGVGYRLPTEAEWE